MRENDPGGGVSLLMARIDDRLVHGQVVVGCCEPLRARRLLVCDDVVAADGLRRSLFAAAVPPGIEVEFRDRPTALERLRELGDAETGETILLTRDCSTMRALAVGVATIDDVVVGGLHRRPEAQEALPGFFLTSEDRDDLTAMLRRGVRVRFQAVPGAAATDAGAVLGIDGDAA